MAIILGTKPVLDTKKYNDYAIGISLPIQMGNVAFNQTFQTAEQAKSNIKNLLLTAKYERVMQPEFGSGLQELLFQFNDDDLESKVEDTIIAAVSKWLPYVTIEDILVEQTNVLKDANQINLSIKFRVSDNASLDTVTFTVQG